MTQIIILKPQIENLLRGLKASPLYFLFIAHSSSALGRFSGSKLTILIKTLIKEGEYPCKCFCI